MGNGCQLHIFQKLSNLEMHTYTLFPTTTS